MTEAIFGLIGVVVGGVLSGAVTWAMQRRTERRAVRAAARLLAYELRGALSYIEGELRPVESDWQSRALSSLGTELWAKHRALLASALSGSEWTAVSAAFEVVEAMRENRWPVAEQEDALATIQRGLDALGRVSTEDEVRGVRERFGSAARA